MRKPTFLVDFIFSSICSASAKNIIVYIYTYMPVLLDLFCGTGSVSKVALALGFDVVSLDLLNADINTDVMDWDYTIFPPKHFDVIWSSPPCQYFSAARRSNIGRFGITKESMETDILEKGVPVLRKTEQIIEYLQPALYFIENPQTGRMKDFVDRPYYDVDYCMYGFSCRKRTRVWTNLIGFDAKLCNKQCGSFVGGCHTTTATGGSRKQKGQGSGTSKDSRYRIPADLIRELLTTSDSDTSRKDTVLLNSAG